MSHNLKFGERVASAVRKMAGSKQRSWYTPFMAAASRAISQRIPLVDFVLDVRDARVPMSSECELLKGLSLSSCCRIVVMNKSDLAYRSHIKEWMRYFQHQHSLVFSVNSHNKDSIQEFLNFLQAQVRALKKAEPERHTITMMLVGIPNVGKSALANSLHQIGRISAAEKGKLKHALVSPLPGETKCINSLKVASHPNVYVLDTPGILPAQIFDTEVCAKLALAGSLDDSLVGETILAQCLLSVLNVRNEYQQWQKLSICKESILAEGSMAACMGTLESKKTNETADDESSTDHTKDSVVFGVRRSLYEVMATFTGNLQDEQDMLMLVQKQFRILKEDFKLIMESEEDADLKVAVKLLNLYRTGRLGHHTLDAVPVIDE